MSNKFAIALIALLAAPGPAAAAETPVAAPVLIEAGLRLPASADNKKRVALTLDACSGLTDQRILSVLVDEKIPATIFVTARWLRKNPQALAVLKAHPDLFAVENHGAMHVPAVDIATRIYGIKAAGSPKAVEAEVMGGANAIVAAGLPKPKWYRGATAEYTQSSMRQIEALGFRVAGFSLNGDRGASLPARAAETSIRNARDGDVIIGHINQPHRPAGQGVAAAILDLKKRGFEFVHLDNAVYAQPARRPGKLRHSQIAGQPALPMQQGVYGDAELHDIIEGDDGAGEDLRPAITQDAARQPEPPR